MKRLPQFLISGPALKSLESIALYTEQNWGKAQRIKYINALVSQFEALAKAPGKGRPCDHLQPGLRSYHQSRHVIFYQVKGRDIIIADILHQSMDPSLHVGDAP